MSKPPGPGRPAARSIAFGAAGMILVGSSVAVSRTLTAAPLCTAQAIRYSLAAVILVAAARRLRIPIVRPRGREWLLLAGLSAAGLVLFNVAIVRGVAHAQPAMIAVAVACVPVLLGVVGPLMQRQRPRLPVVAAAAIVTVGAVLVEGAGHASAAGIAWAAVALACEAAFTLLAVPLLARHGAWGVSVHAVWLGAVMFAVLGRYRRRAGRRGPADRIGPPGRVVPGRPGHRRGVRPVVLGGGRPGTGARGPYHGHRPGRGGNDRDRAGQPGTGPPHVGRDRGRGGRASRRTLGPS